MNAIAQPRPIGRAKDDLDAIRQESEDEFRRLKGLYEQAGGRVG